MRENNQKRLGAFAVTAVVITLVTALVMGGSPAVAQTSGTTTTARWSGSIDTTNRGAVNSAYWSRYAPKLSLGIDWLGGSILGCLAGLVSSLSNQGTLSALNFVRSMSGLAPVTFSSTMNAQAQRAALIMDANNALDHTPSSSWRCWSSTGAYAAAKSNLAMAWPELKSGQIIDMYMDDRGSGNTAVGHRRWVLNPFTTTMGSGSTSTANALMVMGPTSSARPNPRYVSWPSAGWFPTPLDPAGRWSLSAGNKYTNFTGARIYVYRNGVRIPVTKYSVKNGYAMPTLVWQLPSSVPRTGTFTVGVTNITRPGVSGSYKHSYSVKFFTPYR